MIRALLSIAISGACLGLGLETARVQSENCACGARLDELKRRCDLLEAGAEGLRFRIDARLAQIQFDELNREPTPGTRAEP